MRLISSALRMQRMALCWKRDSARVALVPTMGYLHEGHLSLVRHARRDVGEDGQVVVSIFVNPTQFGPNEDLARYPRDLKRDRALCRSAGVDVIFAPSTAEMYSSDFSTYVVEESLSKMMEGASRPTHFRGVATVVAKLFNLVLPEVTVFGAKDFQQAAVVRRMIRDLNFPIRLRVARTHREGDGLAMSSRNKYLSKAERSQATILSELITEARHAVAKGAVAASVLKRQLAGLTRARPATRIDYIEFFDPETLRPVRMVTAGNHLALAVFVGKTRLIDNGAL